MIASMGAKRSGACSKRGDFYLNRDLTFAQQYGAMINQ
jgi:hypothetical protein